MKNESIVMYVLRLAVTLLLITGVVAAALAGVNAITKDAIAANHEKKTQDALALVLPDAGNLQKTELAADTGIVSEVNTDGEYYAVKVLPSGFDGTITMMVGVFEGKVTGISVISHTETPVWAR